MFSFIERMVTDDCGVGKGLESVVLNCDFVDQGMGRIGAGWYEGV